MLPVLILQNLGISFLCCRILVSLVSHGHSAGSGSMHRPQRERSEFQFFFSFCPRLQIEGTNLVCFSSILILQIANSKQQGNQCGKSRYGVLLRRFLAKCLTWMDELGGRSFFLEVSVRPTCCHFKSQCDKMMDWDGRPFLKGPGFKAWHSGGVTLFMRGKSFVHLCAELQLRNNWLER